MERLPTFDSAKYESTYFAILATKNAMTIQAIESHLSAVIEAVNSLIDKDSSIDLENFKATFLKELAILLNQKTEFDFSNSLFDLLGTERTELRNNCISLEKQVQVLTERVSKIESALGHEKIEETEKSKVLDF
jgi:hypothetical protein